MNFIRLRIANFLTIGDAVAISLHERGLNLLQGENLDDPSAKSNGAGKSSIADALCWVLYGSTARGESGDAVVNAIRGKDCFVEVLLQDGDTVYTVTRHRKHKVGKNTVTLNMETSAGSAKSLTKGTDKETQLEIEKILGCTEEVFVASIYMGQENTPDLPAMTDKQLKTLIEQAAGVSRLERAHEVARKKLLGVTQERSIAVTRTDQLKMQLKASQVDLEVGKLKYQEFEKGRSERAQALNTKALAVAKQAKELSDKAKLVVVEQVEAQIATIKDQLSASSAIQVDVAKYRDGTVAQASAGKTLTSHAVTRQKAQVNEIARKIANATEELTKPCATCGKPHTPDELESFVGHLRVSLAAANTELKALEKADLDAQVVYASAQKHLALLQSKLPDISAATDQMEAHRRSLQDRERTLAESGTLAATARQLVAQAQAEKSAPNPHQAVIDLCSEKIAKLEVDIGFSSQTQSELDTKVQIAEAVAQTFSPAGVRAHILDTVTPFLNERTAVYLGTLSDGNISAVWSTLSTTAKGELREKFEIAVTNEKGSQTYRGLSGGEKRKVRLATVLAMQDLVASRASKPISIFIGDEIDDALDDAGLERLMVILQEKAKEKGTVLVISHRSLRDHIDAVTVVTKRGGVSSVSGSLVESA